MSRKPPGPMFTNGDYERDWNRQQEEMLPSMYPPLRPADTLNPGPGFPLDAPRILGASSSHRFDNHPPFPSSSSFPEAESPYASTSRHHRHQYQQFQQQQQQQQPLHAKVIRAQYRHSSDSTLQDARPKLEKHAKRTRRHRSISPSGSSNFSSSGSSRSSASDQQLDHSQMAVEAMKQMYGMRNRDMAQLPYAQLKPFIELMRYEWGYSAKMLYVSKLMKTVQGEAESRIRARDRANLYVGCRVCHDPSFSTTIIDPITKYGDFPKTLLDHLASSNHLVNTEMNREIARRPKVVSRRAKRQRRSEDVPIAPLNNLKSGHAPDGQYPEYQQEHDGLYNSERYRLASNVELAYNFHKDVDEHRLNLPINDARSASISMYGGIDHHSRIGTTPANHEQELPVRTKTPCDLEINDLQPARPSGSPSPSIASLTEARQRRKYIDREDLIRSQISDLETEMTAFDLQEPAVLIGSEKTARFPLFTQEGPIADHEQALQVLSLGSGQEITDTLPLLPYLRVPLRRIQIQAVASLWHLRTYPAHPPKIGFFLADALGSGKTLVALTSLVKDMMEKPSEDNAQPKPTMIICPDGCLSVWQTEISKHVPKLLPYLSVVTTPEGWFTLMDAKLQNEPNSVIAIVPFRFVSQFSRKSPSTRKHTAEATEASRRVEPAQFRPYRIIVDEVHMANDYHLVLAKELIYISESASEVIVLSGTPVVKSIKDIYVPMKIIGATNLSAEEYTAAAPTRGQGKTVRNRQIEWLETRLIESKCYMARDTEHPDMRHGIVINAGDKRVVECSPSREELILLKVLQRTMQSTFQRRLDSLAAEHPDDTSEREHAARDDLEQVIPLQDPMRMFIEAFQMANYSWKTFLEWYSKEHGSGKRSEIQLSQADLDVIHRYVPNVPVTAKMKHAGYLVREAHSATPWDKFAILADSTYAFSPMQETLHALGYKRWKSTKSPTPDLEGNGSSATTKMGYYVVYDPYDSTITSRQEKDGLLKVLEDEPEVKLLIGTIGPLTVGKNLQCCNHLILLDHPGSESAVRQIEGRIVRTPQNKPVSIYRLVTKHTIDETIERVIREKTNMDSLTYSELESNLSFINAARI